MMTLQGKSETIEMIGDYRVKDYVERPHQYVEKEQ